MEQTLAAAADATAAADVVAVADAADVTAAWLAIKPTCLPANPVLRNVMPGACSCQGNVDEGLFSRFYHLCAFLPLYSTRPPIP